MTLGETQERLDQSTARIAELASEHAEAIAEKELQIATLQAEKAELLNLKTTMETTVSRVLQSGDPEQYEALARSFLDPVTAEKQARIAELRRQADALESELP